MFAVEAKVFNNGKIVAKVREARPDEVEGCTETRTCDVWIDLFEDYKEACRFKNDYKNA